MRKRGLQARRRPGRLRTRRRPKRQSLLRTRRRPKRQNLLRTRRRAKRRPTPRRERGQRCPRADRLFVPRLHPPGRKSGLTARSGRRSWLEGPSLCRKGKHSRFPGAHPCAPVSSPPPRSSGAARPSVPGPTCRCDPSPPTLTEPIHRVPPTRWAEPAGRRQRLACLSDRRGSRVPRPAVPGSWAGPAIGARRSRTGRRQHGGSRIPGRNRTDRGGDHRLPGRRTGAPRARLGDHRLVARSKRSSRRRVRATSRRPGRRTVAGPGRRTVAGPGRRCVGVLGGELGRGRPRWCRRRRNDRRRPPAGNSRGRRADHRGGDRSQCTRARRSGPRPGGRPRRWRRNGAARDR